MNLDRFALPCFHRYLLLSFAQYEKAIPVATPETGPAGQGYIPRPARGDISRPLKVGGDATDVFGSEIKKQRG